MYPPHWRRVSVKQWRMLHVPSSLCVNHHPRVEDDSLGFWRSVCLIPFTRQFTGKDADLRLVEKLRGEAVRAARHRWPHRGGCG
jgi:hypothetical protein